MPTHQDSLLAAAKAQDLYDLQQHIAWTDVLRPKLQATVDSYSKILVAEALGSPIPGGKTREQIAGIAYGINYMIQIMENILKDGERALEQLDHSGIKLNS